MWGRVLGGRLAGWPSQLSTPCPPRWPPMSAVAPSLLFPWHSALVQGKHPRGHGAADNVGGQGGHDGVSAQGWQAVPLAGNRQPVRCTTSGPAWGRTQVAAQFDLGKTLGPAHTAPCRTLHTRAAVFATCNPGRNQRCARPHPVLCCAVLCTSRRALAHCRHHTGCQRRCSQTASLPAAEPSGVCGAAQPRAGRPARHSRVWRPPLPRRYNPRVPLSSQLNIGGPLLSRFDIVILLLDQMSPEVTRCARCACLACSASGSTRTSGGTTISELRRRARRHPGAPQERSPASQHHLHGTSRGAVG